MSVAFIVILVLTHGCDNSLKMDMQNVMVIDVFLRLLY
jgi:hypothetical protein